MRAANRRGRTQDNGKSEGHAHRLIAATTDRDLIVKVGYFYFITFRSSRTVTCLLVVCVRVHACLPAPIRWKLTLTPRGYVAFVTYLCYFFVKQKTARLNVQSATSLYLSMKKRIILGYFNITSIQGFPNDSRSVMNVPCRWPS